MPSDEKNNSYDAETYFIAEISPKYQKIYSLFWGLAACLAAAIFTCSGVSHCYNAEIRYLKDYG